MYKAKALPEGTTLKQINQLKRKLNFGDIPAFYHMISTSVADIDGQFRHGFDSAQARILDRSNWNTGHLQDPASQARYSATGKPRLAIYQLFTEWGFEVHCFPYLMDKEVDEFLTDHPMMEFRQWDPSHMRKLISVPNLQKFIDVTFSSGDKADYALLQFTIQSVDKVLARLKAQLQVEKVCGVSIQSYIDAVIKKMARVDPDGLPPHVTKRLDKELLYHLQLVHKRQQEEKQSTPTPNSKGGCAHADD